MTDGIHFFRLSPFSYDLETLFSLCKVFVEEYVGGYIQWLAECGVCSCVQHAVGVVCEPT